MEIYRKIYNDIVKWKNESKGRTALLIEGARRIGKSTIAEKFAKEFYKSYVIIDFSHASKKIKDNFLENLNDLDKFFQIISIEYNKELFNRNTLLIFDEIQEFPKAREAIKHLVKDGRYDYIETGSLISIKENVNDIVIPSEEQRIKMYPVSFEEFLIASNEIVLLNYIKECYDKLVPLEQKFHRKAMYLFEEYILVGGMPQSITAYLENGRSFYAADRVKRNILDLYRDDIRKAAKKYNSKVSALFEYLPSYLSKHDKKIVLSEIDKNKVYSQYDEPFFWLDDSMICNLCYKCNDPSVGFGLNMEQSALKCYMGDTGLLVSHAFSENAISSEQLYKNIMSGKLAINEGMLYENVISQMIVFSGRKLYFYTHYSEEKRRNDIEIDFMLSNNDKTKIKVFPIEVKSSKNYTSISFDAFVKKFGKRIAKGYVIHPKSLLVENNVIRIPPYMLTCLLEDMD